MVRWRHAPPAYMQGVRTKYIIYYKTNTEISNVSHYYYKEDLALLFLTSHTNYTIWMFAYTKVGEGNVTNSVICKTFETGVLSYWN